MPEYSHNINGHANSHNTTSYYDPHYVTPSWDAALTPTHSHAFTNVENTSLLTAQLNILVSLLTILTSRVDKLEEKVNNG